MKSKLTFLALLIAACGSLVLAGCSDSTPPAPTTAPATTNAPAK